MSKKQEFENEKEKLISTQKNMNEIIIHSEQTIKKLYQTGNSPSLIAQLTKIYSETINKLENSREKPYFARIDFTEKGNKLEKHYIGKCSVIDQKGKIHVIDWRAPVSSLYYDARLGETSYKAPEGQIVGELELKRLFDIEKGVLESYSDVDISANDELLKPYLKADSNSRLKNIVSTIQQEQNTIIRANMNVPLIVQGVAGSGKTTVALHRIAYLVYEQQKELNADDFLIIAPNKFFLDYIANTLPDLGVNDVNQETFEQFAKSVIGSGILIENPYTKLADIVNGNNTKNENNKLVIESSEYKSSLDFKDALDKYLVIIEKDFLPHADLKIGNIIILSYDKLLERFKSGNKSTPIYEKFIQFSKRIQMFVENNIDAIDDSLRKQRQQEINQINLNLSEEEQKAEKIELYNEYEPLFEQLKNNGKKLISNYVKQCHKIKVLEHYKKFVTELNSFSEGKASKEVTSHIKDKFYSDKKNNQVEHEDLTPLMYLTNKIYGTQKKKIAKHIVIDEAQDYSSFQFMTLKEILNSQSMTILGDIAQGIQSYRGTKDWQEVNQKVFDNSANILTLDKSYRTTVEIMNVANKVISKIQDKINLAEPVIRHGDDVNIEKKENLSEIEKSIEDRIIQLKEDGQKNIAVITKTLQEATEISKKLTKNKLDVNLISEKSNEYNAGVSVIPSYLVKGLEFDSVIITNVNNDNYTLSEIDAKLLYVALTRAMHTSDIYYTGEMTKLLG